MTVQWQHVGYPPHETRPPLHLADLGAALRLLRGFAKVGVENINPDQATFIRTIVVLLAFSVLLFFTGRFAVPSDVSSKTWLFLVLSGLATGASWLCYFRALKLGPATLVAPIDKLSVVLVALFAFAFLGERPTAQGWVGIAMIGAGAVLLAVKF